MACWSDLPTELKLQILAIALANVRGLTHSIILESHKANCACRHPNLDGHLEHGESSSYSNAAPMNAAAINAKKLGVRIDEDLDMSTVVAACARHAGVDRLPDSVIARIIFYMDPASRRGLSQSLERRGVRIDSLEYPSMVWRLSAGPGEGEQEEEEEEEEAEFTDGSATPSDSSSDSTDEVDDPHDPDVLDSLVVADQLTEWDDPDVRSRMTHASAQAAYRSWTGFSFHAGLDDRFLLLRRSRHFFGRRVRNVAYPIGRHMNLRYAERSDANAALWAVGLRRVDRNMTLLVRQVVPEHIADLRAQYQALMHRRYDVLIEVDQFRWRVPSDEWDSPEHVAFRMDVLHRWRCEDEIDWIARLVRDLEMVVL